MTKHYPDTPDALAWALAFADHFKQYFKELPPTTDLHEFFAHCIAEGKEMGYIQAGIDDNVRHGFIEKVGHDENGTPMYRMTETGKRRVENMLAGRNG